MSRAKGEGQSSSHRVVWIVAGVIFTVLAALVEVFWGGLSTALAFCLQLKAEWASALISLGTAGIAGWALYLAQRSDRYAQETLRRQQEDRTEERRDREEARIDRVAEREDRAAARDERRRAQASQIAAWIGHPLEPAGPVRVILGNASQIPAYDVRVAYWPNYPGGASVKSPGVRTLPPGELAQPWQESFKQPEPADLVTNGRLQITFRDANSQRWVRHPDGQLHTLEPWGQCEGKRECPTPAKRRGTQDSAEATQQPDNSRAHPKDPASSASTSGVDKAPSPVRQAEVRHHF